MAKKWIEQRKRGFFGWIFLLIFWGWNLLVVVGLADTFAKPELNCDLVRNVAERQGCQAGVGLGFLMWLMLWAAGAVVFGLLAYFTRGRREMIEVDVP